MALVDPDRQIGEVVAVFLQLKSPAQLIRAIGRQIDFQKAINAVETLTAQIEARIKDELNHIDKLGGVIRGIEEHYFQRVMAQDAYDWQKKFERGEIVRIGVNVYQSEEQNTKPVTVYRADPNVERARIKELSALKKERDTGKVTHSLESVKKVARLPGSPENNLMPVIIDAVRCYATIGEIADALREVWGECRQGFFF